MLRVALVGDSSVDTRGSGGHNPIGGSLKQNMFYNLTMWRGYTMGEFGSMLHEHLTLWRMEDFEGE